MQCIQNQYKQNHAHNLNFYSSFSSRLLNSVIEGEQTVTDFRKFDSKREKAEFVWINSCRGYGKFIFISSCNSSAECYVFW